MFHVVFRNLLIVIYTLSCSGSITSAGEERELVGLLSFTCNYVVSVGRGYLFLWVLGVGCVILLVTHHGPSI